MKQATTRFSQTGLSLLELMVAMTLGLMITMTLGYILMGSRSTYRTQDASARVQDTGRFALDFIGRQLRAAGRIDITPLASDARTNLTLPSNWAPISGEDGVIAVAAEGENPAVEAVNGEGEVAADDGQPRPTDTLTVQYQLTDMAGETIADCNGNGASIAKTLIGTLGGVAYHYGTVVNRISLNGATRELRCLGNGAAGALPIAEGVEDLQILYAERDAPNEFLDITDVAPADVVAVQVCIIVRSLSNGVITAPQRMRDCSGKPYNPTDTRLRRTFTSVFTLRNRVISVP